jgi:D-alanyl-D-alanine carboxypeptidase
MPGYKGGKHGYTDAANQTLVAVFSEESLGGRELGYVLLGSDDVRLDTELLRTVIQNSVRFE